jgi:hypothetical protein
MSLYRYIHLDSTYRNRNLYPLQSQYIINPDQQQNYSVSGINAQDGVTLAYPFYPVYPDAPVFAGGTALEPVLDAAASSIDNFYVGNYLEDTTIGESRLITSYDAIIQTVTLDSAFSGAWAAGDSFVIRKELPTLQTTVAAATSTTITLSAGSSQDSIYVGNYIYIPSQGENGLITAYDGSTLTVTFTPSLSSVPAAATPVEILGFSYDGAGKLFNILTTVNDLACYEVTLVSINLPNVLLSNTGGGKIINYSYILVELTNETLGGVSNTLITNNPFARKSLFVASIDDTPNADLAFVKLDGDGVYQTINFNPNSALKISIYLPNGELIRTLDVDTTSPQPPNPLIQIMALFEVKRNSCGRTLESTK